jgi:hypothetical protein
MKLFKSISILAIVAMLMVAVGPAYAQLGEADASSFTVQNVDSVSAIVTIRFYSEGGVVYTPATLNSGKTNPFTLVPGESFEVYLPNISDTLLPDGRYSVVIESTAHVVAIANLIGEGTINFNGSYSGFDMGSNNFYLPGVVYNYYGWFSLISVQNVGTTPADVTVTITCTNGKVGTLTQNAIPVNSSHHFVLKTTIPTGLLVTDQCNGSAVISTAAVDDKIVVVDNQSVPSLGNTQSYSGVMAGSPKVYIPALYTGYYGWNASLNIQKLGTGNTTVTITYSDGGTSTCDLTDAAPACLRYMPTYHPATGYYAATITNSANLDLMVIANAANGDQAQTYNGVGSGSLSVGIPSVMKNYYGWNTSFTCQNVGTSPAGLLIEYEGYPANAYTTADVPINGTKEIYTPSEAFLPTGYQGAVTVTADVPGSEISCIVNFNQPTLMGTTIGDWSMSYNAFNR